tara:strand:+ start:2312 stop:5776 length:3465 start_codon:yes stop_codon:yes gene_type:complete
MPTFNDRVFGANVDPDTLKKINQLQGGVDLTANIHGEADKNRNYEYTGNTTIFARMWAPILQEELIEGAKEPEQKIKCFIINDNRGNSYEPNATIDTTSNIIIESTSNDYLKPNSGITSISTKTEGSLGAILRTDVDFVVHNKKDFDEIILPFFLKPATTVILDYGRSSKDVVLYDISKVISNVDTELTGLKDYIYGVKDDAGNPNIIGYTEKYKGNVESIIGKVQDYNVTVNEQGSFVCSIKLISENATLLDKAITEDNKLKYVFKNQMEDIIVSVLAGDLKETTLSTYSNFSADEKEKVRDNLFNRLQISSDIDPKSDKPFKKELIPRKAIQAGVFYQNILNASDILSVGPTSDTSTEGEVLYISWGLFEDLFLNSIISGNTTNKKHDISFNTRESIMRYEPNLVARQVQILQKGEQLPLFLYPKDWQSTYNGKTPADEFNNQKNGNNKYKTSIIPLREMFFSVKLISDSFYKKQNVNDAIEDIIEKVNKDSYDVFKLKMISLNNSNSSISIQDANLIPIHEPEEKVLIFDVTSQYSIVKNMDYKLEMPKGGLDSMIAIGDKGSDYTFFDEPFKDNLNFIRILQDVNENIKGKKPRTLSFRSLPLPPKKNVDEIKKENETIKLFEFGTRESKRFSKNADIQLGNVKDTFAKAVQSMKSSKIETIEKEKKPKNTPPPKKTESQNYQARNSVPANSFRDYYGKQAQIKTLLSDDASSVPPFMPISISITVFGNNYLNIGNFILVNFLPTVYKNKIDFMIVGIEHKVDSTWSTTYNCQMRIRPTSKSRVIDLTKMPKPVLNRKYTIESANSDGQEGSSNVTLADSTPISNDAKPYDVGGEKQRRIITATTKDASLYEKKAFLGEQFNHVKMVFGDTPSSIEDLAFLHAFQKIMAQLVNKGQFDGLKTVYAKTLDPNLKNPLSGMSEKDPHTDFYALGLYQDEDSFTRQESSARDYLIPFIENIALNPNLFGVDKNINRTYKNAGSALLSTKLVKILFGDDPEIKKAFTIPFIEGDLKPNRTVVHLGDETDPINLKQGVLIKAWSIKVSELADEKLNNKRKALGIKKTLPAYGEEAYTYGLHINKYNTTTGFVPNVRIPAWLVGEDSNITNSDTNFSGGISIFLKDFQKEYFNSEKKIVDFFKSIDGKSIAQIGIL